MWPGGSPATGSGEARRGTVTVTMIAGPGRAGPTTNNAARVTVTGKPLATLARSLRRLALRVTATVSHCPSPTRSAAARRVDPHSVALRACGQTPKSPNPGPAPSRFGRENSRDFPDPDWAGIGKIFGILPRSRFGRDPGKSGNPDLAGIGN